jgi:hypothetical protein
MAQKETTPIGLGPVSLRLGEKRRQPAPHLKPRAPKAKSKAAPRDPLAGLPNIPKARPSSQAPKSSSHSPKSTVAKNQSAAAPPKVDEKDVLAAEVAERMRAAEAARGGPRRRRKSIEPEASPSIAPALPIRPDAEESIRARMMESEPDTAEVPRSQRPARGSSGRFRMQAKKIMSAPVVRRRVEEKVDYEDQKTDEIPLPTRRPMPVVGAGTMDDFFGAAAQMGRLSMPKRNDNPSEE